MQQDDDIIQRARRNEHTYRQLYSKLLRENKSIFDKNNANSISKTSNVKKKKEDDDDYAEETHLLETVFENERNAFLASLGVAAFVFGTLRFGPRFFLHHFGNIDKKQALKVADEHAQKGGTVETQTTIAVLIEGSFSLWFGYRAYDHMSHQSKGTYETIADIPLCKGRSRISDSLCTDWVKVTTTEIPSSFWDVLNKKNTKKTNDDGDNVNVAISGLKDERTWYAIQRFSQNCMLRAAEEDRIRKEQQQQGTEEEEEFEEREHISLPESIPSKYDNNNNKDSDIVSKASKGLSTNDVISLVNDRTN